MSTPSTPFKYLYGDGLSIERAAIDRSGPALADARRIVPRVEDELLFDLERVPACRAWCFEHEPRLRRARNPTYLAAFMFAALPAAALYSCLALTAAALCAWLTITSSFLRTRSCAQAHARTNP